MYDAEAELKRLVRRWRGRGRGEGKSEGGEGRKGGGGRLPRKVCDTKVKLKRLMRRRRDVRGEGDGEKKGQEG